MAKNIKLQNAVAAIIAINFVVLIIAFSSYRSYLENGDYAFEGEKKYLAIKERQKPVFLYSKQFFYNNKPDTCFKSIAVAPNLELLLRQNHKPSLFDLNSRSTIFPEAPYYVLDTLKSGILEVFTFEHRRVGRAYKHTKFARGFVFKKYVHVTPPSIHLQ